MRVAYTSRSERTRVAQGAAQRNPGIVEPLAHPRPVGPGRSWPNQGAVRIRSDDCSGWKRNSKVKIALPMVVSLLSSIRQRGSALLAGKRGAASSPSFCQGLF
jgi:hypothetical protein